MSGKAGGGIRMIAFAGEGVFSPVLDSQVLVPLAALARHAPHIERTLLVLTSCRYRGSAKLPGRCAAIRAALPGVRVVFRFRTFLWVPLEDRRWARHLRRTLVECGYDGTEPIIVHCRGPGTTAAAAALKRHDERLRVLFDMRGAAVDEIANRGLLGWYLRGQGCRTRTRAFGGADALNTVSQKLAEYVRGAGLLTRDMPASVVGCCADTQRFRFDAGLRAARRRELGFDDQFVVCYCGQMSHWQRPDAVAQAFAAIRAGMPDARMLIISHEAEVLVRHLRRAGVPSDAVTVRTATHDQVASLLMAADVGLLLRENTLTNRVASPVKFAEYLRCGLPVILTPYVGDFSALATAEGVGQTVEFPPRPDEVLHAAQALRARLATEGDAYRQRCSRVAGQRFAWDAQLPQIIRLYETLAGV
jgi:glycosyltransferase involved in cell wall biosynthesis